VTLELTISGRPEALVDLLAERLAAPSDDPFAPDLVVVPNAGMREWTATRLIDRLGVLAGVEFVFPAELTRRTLGLPDPDDDPWRPERMAWHVLALMADGVDLGRTPWDGLPARPWTVSRRVADLLERAASQRPDLVASWRAADGEAELGPARAWQAVTWRALRERIGMPSPAERLLDAAAPHTLPERLHVMGLSSLAAPFAGVLAVASRAADVHVLATTASEAVLRAAIAGVARPDDARALLVAPPRADDVPHDLHPLLASWGRPAIEAATMLARLPVTPTLLEDVASTSPSQPPASQLVALQAAVRDAAPVDTAPAERERGGDGSVQVHACHGLVRQLEVLRDALLHAMEADPTLEPRDVAVLCADLEAVAPLAEPILGADVGGRHLPVLVTDRAASTTPPVQAAFDAALALATSRLERGDVLTFLAMPAVAVALGLDAEDLAVLERIADDLDVRWGRDATHRERWGYPRGVTVGTWRETLDRLLAGLLLDPDVGTVDVGDGEVTAIAPAAVFGMQDLGRIGRLADALAAVGQLATYGNPTSGPRPIAEWAAPLRWIVDTLLRPRRAVDAATQALAAQAAQARELVDRLVGDAAAADAVAAADAGAADRAVALDVREVRAALADRWGGAGARARLRTGHVSVASLTPLRGVPFRVVALVGVSDTLLSARGADDDDVLALTPRVGERDASGERRAALLDTLLAARDRLIVTCDGQDVRTGATLDLPTAVEELLDAVPPVVPSTANGAPLVVRHPRHLADRRNLTTGPGSLPRVDASRPWTFAPAALHALAAIEAAAGGDVAPRPAAGVGVLTATTRGSSVGSASMACSNASRSTSSWRTSPWHAWTCTLPSPPRSRSAGAVSTGAASRTAAWSATSCDAGGCDGDVDATSSSSVGVTGRRASIVAASIAGLPHEASSGCRSCGTSSARGGATSSARASSGRATPAIAARSTASDAVVASTCTSAARDATASTPANGAASDERPITCRRSGSACGATASSSRSAGDGMPIRSRGARHVTACQARAGPSSASPSAARQEATRSGRCEAARSSRSATRRETVHGRAGSPSHGVRPRSTPSAISASTCQAMRSGRHGSSSGSGSPSVRRVSSAGNTNSTPASTPSRSISRVAVHSRMPALGTTTRSGANGSSEGAASRSASRSTSASGRPEIVSSSVTPAVPPCGGRR